VDATGDDRIQQVVKEARDLIKALESTSVRRVSLEAGNFKIEIERAFAKSGTTAAISFEPASGGGAAEAGSAVKDSYHRVLAPLVGTFYHSPSPGAKAFVEVGARVQRGQVIGVIEAMKIMNEVESDAAGVVLEILVPNGQPVQYEQPLLVLDTKA